MHLATLNAEATDLMFVPPGRYYLQDVNTGEAMSRGLAHTVTHVPLPPIVWPDDRSSLIPHPSSHGSGTAAAPESVLFIRAGGFGDLLMFTAVLAAIAERHPMTKLGVACFDVYAPLLEGLPFPVERVRYPIAEADWHRFQAHASMEGVIESNPELHAVDAMANAAGFPLDLALALPSSSQSELTKPSSLIPHPSSLRRPLYSLRDDEREAAWDFFPKLTATEKRLGIQVGASAECRTYPPTLLVHTARLARQHGWRIFLFGSRGQVEQGRNADPNVVDLTSLDRDLTFRGSVAVASTCDVLIAPDSAFVHVAGALDLPCVALYGPFHWKQRTAHYPTVRALQGRAPCAPCHYHVRGGEPFPLRDAAGAATPCSQTGYCHALADITPQRVIDSVNKLHTGHHASVAQVPAYN